MLTKKIKSNPFYEDYLKIMNENITNEDNDA